MTQSMKDLLLGLGFKPSSPPAAKESSGAAPARGHRPPRPDRASERPTRGARRPAQRAQGAADAGVDLARAYALRAQQEKHERAEAERQRQEAAQRKREAKAAVAGLLVGKALNDAGADIARHFDYNGKIRRIHVTAAQLKALNAGELAVVQMDGRYLLVDAALAQAVRELLPSLVALHVDPQAPAVDDPYSDPRYAIPDDLVW